MCIIYILQNMTECTEEITLSYSPHKSGSVFKLRLRNAEVALHILLVYFEAVVFKMTAYNLEIRFAEKPDSQTLPTD